MRSGPGDQIHKSPKGFMKDLNTSDVFDHLMILKKTIPYYLCIYLYNVQQFYD